MTKAELVQEMAAAVREQRAADREVNEAAVAALRAEILELRELVTAIPVPNDGKDGKDADPVAIVQEVLAQIPVPKDGRDGVNGKDGRDAEVDTDAIVKMVFPLIPVPENGKDGRDGIDGKDGADGKDATVDVDEIAVKAASLIPLPKDGKDGEPGKDAEPIDRVTLAKDVLALIPIPKDGKDGIASRDEVRTEVAKAVAEFTAPEVEKRVQETFDSLPVNIYRGVYQQGVEYKAGNTATWAGSLWHANADTTDKPGEGQTAWTLMAKKGRDGKDATVDLDAIVKAVRAKVVK